jgi:2-polyprenyl-3-methyl-5-hydroxy-6-metoxy-1,4-benzoquinol methylase
MKTNTLDLRECVEWRSWLWTKPVDWLLNDRSRFAGKRLLDLGCRYGKMSCYFASLGAFVDGVDVEEGCLRKAREHACELGLAERVTFWRYSGNAIDLPHRKYDFVFTKSVLVVMGPIENSLQGICQTLKHDGEYLAVENLAGGSLLALVRAKIVHRRWRNFDTFKGVNATTISQFASSFECVSYRCYWGLVLAIRAQRPN